MTDIGGLMLKRCKTVSRQNVTERDCRIHDGSERFKKNDHEIIFEVDDTVRKAAMEKMRRNSRSFTNSRRNCRCFKYLISKVKKETTSLCFPRQEWTQGK